MKQEMPDSLTVQTNAQAQRFAGAVGGLWHLATNEHRGEQVPWSQLLAIIYLIKLKFTV